MSEQDGGEEIGGCAGEGQHHHAKEQRREVQARRRGLQGSGHELGLERDRDRSSHQDREGLADAVGRL